MILVFALFAILGVGIGSVLTNQVAAIIVSLGWFFVLDGLVVNLVHGAAVGADRCGHGGRQPDPRPGHDFGLFTWWQGALLMLAYGLVFASLGSHILTRRDIT